MKNISFILILLVLTSCGNSLEPPTSNTDYTNVIGKTVTIGSLEIAQYDFPERMDWEDAKKACSALGEGWRLPDRKELSILFMNKNQLGGFVAKYYWSSLEFAEYNAWKIYFLNGFLGADGKKYMNYVRAVKGKIKNNTKEIIGTPKKIGNLEIAQHDFPDPMRWEDAKYECESLGDGWRLPNEKELYILFQNRDKIGGFYASTYWSSTGDEDDNAWTRSFANGGDGSLYLIKKSSFDYFRAVRTLQL